MPEGVAAGEALKYRDYMKEENEVPEENYPLC